MRKYNPIMVLVLFVFSIAFVIAQDPTLHFPSAPVDSVPVEEFIFFTPQDQALYISSIQDFEDNYQIAYDYFSSSANIMVVPDAFEQFMASQGITIFIDTLAPPSEFYYSPSGKLVGAGGEEVNIYDFSHAKESLKIDDEGNVIIVDSDNGEWPFSGTLSFSQGKFVIDDGEIGSQKIQDGEFILIGGTVRGNAIGFAGLHFEKSTAFEFVENNNIVKLVKATVKSVDADSDITIYGRKVLLPEGDRIEKGRLTFEKGSPVLVGSDSQVTIKGFTHTTQKDKTLRLVYVTSPELDNINAEEQDALSKVSLGSEFEHEWNDQFSKLSALKAKQKELEKRFRELVGSKASSEKINIVKQELESLSLSISLESDVLRKITTKYVPTVMVQEDIHQKYKEQREKLYAEIVPSIMPEENYFMYGDEHIWLGGDGFVSRAEDDNPIFLEYRVVFEGWQTRQRTGRLEFELKGGTMDVVKESPPKRPLALSLTLSGEGTITNGKYVFDADGQQILLSATDVSPSEELVSSDMRFEYHTHSGEMKLYDLNIDAEYYLELTSEERADLLERRAPIEEFLKAYSIELDENPQFKKIIAALEPLEDKLLLLRYDQEEALGQLRRAELAGTPAEKILTKKELDKITASIEDVDRQIVFLEQSAGGYDDFKRLREAQAEYADELDDINFRLVGDIGEIKSGVWGQIISSEDGNSFISYQEYIEGFPIIRNTDVRQWTAETYRQSAGVTVSGEELEIPNIIIKNSDRLQLDVLNGDQQCIDTQFRLAYEYAISTGQDICFGGGKTCLRDPQYFQRPQKFVEDWMASQSTQAYVRATQLVEAGSGSSWEDDIQVLSVDEYDTIQPGDVLILYGHAIGVKDVIEIPPGSGKKYIQQFAGSMPAIDAHIYQGVGEHGGLKSIEQLKSERRGIEGEKKKLLSVFRWKFRPYAT